MSLGDESRRKVLENHGLDQWSKVTQLLESKEKLFNIHQNGSEKLELEP